MKWAYGVTTVPQRRTDLLPRTLASLKLAGFESPRLFVDGVKSYRDSQYNELLLEVTTRWPVIKTYGNWVLSLGELYLRNPTADRYAMFQDDFVTYRNLRQYLEECKYPEKGYWNLYTFPDNQKLAPESYVGWFVANQRGLGAVALVFNREAVTNLFKNPVMVERPQDAHRGWKAVDGGIVTAFNKIGWKEYVHTPSLVQHTGLHSSMRNRTQPLAQRFRGEEFNALDMLTNTIDPNSARIEWDCEMESLQRNRNDDVERLRGAGNSDVCRKLERAIRDYDRRIKLHKLREPAPLPVSESDKSA